MLHELRKGYGFACLCGIAAAMEAGTDTIRDRVRAAAPALSRYTWREAGAAYAALFERAVAGQSRLGVRNPNIEIRNESE